MVPLDNTSDISVEFCTVDDICEPFESKNIFVLTSWPNDSWCWSFDKFSVSAIAQFLLFTMEKVQI